jgi:DNA ligase-associated metallophosphoesterase
LEAKVEITVAGERLEARGDKTLFWPSTSTLFVSDLHLGKGAAFRAGGVPVPTGSTAATLDALSCAVAATAARQVIVLGDLWHAREGRTEENQAALAAWREAHPGLCLSLVIGNHDRRSGWELPATEPGRILGPFALHHHPEPDPAGYVLCGHLHPGVQLSGMARQALRLPCFWFGDRVGVLPAFGDLTGTMAITRNPGDRVVIIAEGKVALLPHRDRSVVPRR